MCEVLGTEPKDSEIPIEFDDLPIDVQEAILVYNMLQDNIDTMNGIYLGKVFTNILDLLSLVEVSDHKTCFCILRILDDVRASIINKKKPVETSS